MKYTISLLYDDQGPTHTSLHDSRRQAKSQRKSQRRRPTTIFLDANDSQKTPTQRGRSMMTEEELDRKLKQKKTEELERIAENLEQKLKKEMKVGA